MTPGPVRPLLSAVVMVVILLGTLSRYGPYPGGITAEYPLCLNDSARNQGDSRMLHNGSVTTSPPLEHSPNTCRLDLFKGYLSGANGLDVESARVFISDCHGIIYNKIPKTGSSLLRQLFKRQQKSNSFRLVYFKPHYNVSEDDREWFMANIGDPLDDFIVVNHQYYYNVSSFTSTPLLHVTVVREPLSWFSSLFSYFKYDVQASVGLAFVKNRTINECFESVQCARRLIQKYGAVHFICGSSIICDDPTTAAALEVARRHVDDHFLLVGILEELDRFVELLQVLLPHMFRHLVQVRRGMELVAHQTSRKENISEASTPILTQLLNNELAL